MKTKTGILAFLLIPALLLAACTTPAATQSPAATQAAAEEAAPQADLAVSPAPSTETLAAYQGTLEDIYARVNPSVVNIQVASQINVANFNSPFGMPFENLPSDPNFQTEGLGSGFIWDTQGHIVTNNHVVEDADQVTVTFADGRTVEAEVVGTDPDSDLAVLKVDPEIVSAPALTLADSDQARVGQMAIAIGNPFGLEGTMTVGIISALNRSLTVSASATASGNGASYNIPDIIQTDAPINPGNSGGVLLNAEGEVLGVTTAIKSPVEANAGIGFVVPANIVQAVVPSLIEKGEFEHPWLGISGGTLTPTLAEAMDLPASTQGVLVAEVTANSPADKAGLLGSGQQVEILGSEVNVGGDVITAINGTPLASFDDLASYLVKNGRIGEESTLAILRDGKDMTLTITLEARPSTKIQNASATLPESRSAWLGIQGMDLTPELATALDLDESQQGVMVVRVTRNSPAAEAGLQGSTRILSLNGERVAAGGDIITAFDGKSIASMDELINAIQAAGPGANITLDILRDGQAQSIEVTLGSSS